MKHIAIQGELGSFHHAAAKTWYGNDIHVIPCDSFKQVFSALHESDTSGAVVAIENSLHGSINEVYDLLLKNNYPIVGEVFERIHQCLIGYNNTPLNEITDVYSHPVALSQCSDFLESFIPKAKRHEHADTAGSVRHIKAANIRSSAAIASKLAAEMYGLSILKEDIQNYAANFTRFLIIEKQENSTITTNKASLVVETSHKPGSLYDALGVLNRYAINMTKLQSRPIPNSPWKYLFYIDIEATKPETDLVINELVAEGSSVRLLGYYTQATQTIDA